jgi:hypothetical protein
MADEKWEEISKDGNGMIVTCRLKVPGGWLYRVGLGSKVAIAYVPDPLAGR